MRTVCVCWQAMVAESMPDHCDMAIDLYRQSSEMSYHVSVKDLGRVILLVLQAA